MRYYSQNQLCELFHEQFDWNKLDVYLQATSDVELQAFINHLKQPNAIVFTAWVEQWQDLFDLLLKSSAISINNDPLRLKEHALFEPFKAFVSPFLGKILLRQLTEGVASSLTFISLLSPSYRYEVESGLLGSLKTKVNRLTSLVDQQTWSDAQWGAQLDSIASDHVIHIINEFSDATYSLKMQYVETIIALAKASNVPTKVANWLLNQLQKIRLHTEHQEQIKAYKTDLLTHKMQSVKKTPKKRIVVTSMSRWYWFGFVALLFGIVVWMESWSAFDNETIEELPSSFTALTKVERQRADSLIKTMQDPVIFQFDDEVDWIEGEELYIEKAFTFDNSKVERFYNMWDEYVQNKATKTDCSQATISYNKASLPKGFSKLATKKEGKLSELENNSNKTIQLIVYQQNKPEAYYQLLLPGEKITFKLEKDDFLGIICGEQPIEYQSSTVVFCQFDELTKETLQTFYRIYEDSNSYYFQLEGTSANDFQLNDFSGYLIKLRK